MWRVIACGDISIACYSLFATEISLQLSEFAMSREPPVKPVAGRDTSCKINIVEAHWVLRSR